MIKFRWHKGSLEESMATAMEFKGLRHLFGVIKGLKNITKNDMTINYYGFDNRVNQDLFIVTIKKTPIGFIYKEVKRCQTK